MEKEEKYMDLQVYRLLEENYSTDLFRSELLHMKRNHSEYEFVSILIRYNFVEVYWKKKWYYKALYTLALLDYLSDKHKAPYFSKYDYYRTKKLQNLAYPSGIEILDKLKPNEDIKKKAVHKCRKDNYGKYFIKYNIVECGEYGNESFINEI